MESIMEETTREAMKEIAKEILAFLSASGSTLPGLILEGSVAVKELLLRAANTLLPNFKTSLVEMSLLGGVLVCSYVVGKILQQRLKPIVRRQKDFFNKAFFLRGFKIVPALVMTLSLSLLRPFAAKVLGIESQVLFYAQNLLFAWIIAHVFLLLFRRAMALWLILLFVLPVAMLLNYELLDDVVRLLDGWTFHFGNVEVSFYRIMKSLVIAVFLFWVAQKILQAVEDSVARASFIRPSLRSLAVKFFQIFLYVIFALWLLNILGVPLTSLTIFSGAVGIGIGFGIQRIAANLISGIIMLMEETLKPDDIVELEDGSWGAIKKTQARYTLVETFDGKEIFIPNEEFISKRVINWTYSHKRARWIIRIGVAYDSDLTLAQRLMLEAANEHAGIAKDPPPFCFLTDFGDSAVHFELRIWFERIDLNIFQPRSELLFAIWHKFREAGIEFPYPQQDVHIRTMPKEREKEKTKTEAEAETETWTDEQKGSG